MNRVEFAPLAPKGVPARRAAWRSVLLVAAVTSLLVAAGCSTRRVSQPAPVEDRSGAKATEVKPLPGAENAGKPGYFTVRPGDTLYRIALESGQAWRDVQAWNNLANPNLIEVGQVLRVAPPATTGAAGAPGATPTTVSSAPVATPGVVARPLTAGNSPAPASTLSPVPAAPAPSEPPVPSAEELQFVWPAQGPVIAPFDEAKNKGVAISGRVGDPIVAAADGRVVYAGAGLRGYGNLIILKHNNTYLTAYAHNQALLVREDQAVRQGQKIAEMGSSDADRVKLHFEVRRLGKPVDPLGHLPKR
ncbi:peptidoglycan DD-metalloendopeptidase family protein [Hydrogenophaga taeniospiralis]|uniref:peptidoglycan DD-metalloendopeptidase family protein n=1 Tax=Hydrogenophaga taeniospiralis TaxID=65656 RepID=UPI001CFBA90E|nr:peptidoglycan DD-metalloendopeptidase family protein [Hydrogenophaga taeniospiralis]UCU92152.1 peptidoglycan DD-metalloendopeptidase family protein [Hydrogenophaga taeniospiralis]